MSCYHPNPTTYSLTFEAWIALLIAFKRQARRGMCFILVWILLTWREMHSHMERNAIMQWNKKWKAGSDPVLKIVEVFEDLSMTFKMDTTEYYFNISTLSLFTLAPVTVNGRKIHVMSGHSLGRNVLNPKTKTSRKSPPPVFQARLASDMLKFNQAGQSESWTNSNVDFAIVTTLRPPIVLRNTHVLGKVLAKKLKEWG